MDEKKGDELDNLISSKSILEFLNNFNKINDMKSTILIKILLCLVFFASAQDAHFSQTDLNASMRNPASLGNIKSDYQLTASYRSQWSSIPSAYRNIVLAFEQKGAKLSWGLQMLHNDAGKASLKNTQAILNLAYRKNLSGQGEFLSLGISGGMIQQRFDPTLLSFDNQYSTENGFDPLSASKENFIKTTHFLPTATIGLFIKKNFNNVKGSGGLSFAHLNEPTSQFYNSMEEKYAMRTSFFANALFPIKENIDLNLHLIFNQQAIALEKIIGAKLNYQLNTKNKLTGGIANRLGDAWILEVGVDFPESALTISYDLNNSALNPATNTKGAWELTFSYQFNQKKKELAINTNFERLNEKPEKKSMAEEILDSDKDGIGNDIDACPHLYGEKENNGCPTNRKDSDFDGILDHIDSCPFLKGTAEMGGCPDSDKDGISDLKDYCPFLKGVASNHGCPEMNKTNHQQLVENNAINIMVEFDTDRSNIKSYFHERLDKAVAFLLENKTAKAFISGHTDNEGDSIYNFELGERRANNVMEYLLTKGVSIHQLSLISFGETKPIERNRSAYEKAKNRRVEVQIYKD